MNIPFVNLDRLHRPIRAEIDEAIKGVIDRHRFINGEEIEVFERNFAQFLRVKHVVGVSSGTDALFLALKACEIGPNDMVVTVPNTFIATTEAVTMAGAEIRFVDVDEQTANLDPPKLVHFIESMAPGDRKRLKAVIFVNLYGSPAGLDEVCRLARKYGVILISDAAQAHGALVDGRSITGFADITTYSFFPGKNLGAFGDAGAVATADDTLAKRIARLRNHGRSRKYLHEIEAYNCRLDTIQAAVLDVKLKYLERWNHNRIRSAALYHELLSDKGFWLPSGDARYQSVFHLYVTRTARRDEWMSRLKEAGISTGVHYPVPLHLQPAYGYLGYKEGDFPVSERLAQEIVSLPIDGTITTEEVRCVAGHLLRLKK
jgi:dTDP-4-amino-4,6-dideoxygalactose transaminase